MLNAVVAGAGVDTRGGAVVVVVVAGLPVPVCTRVRRSGANTLNDCGLLAKAARSAEVAARVPPPLMTISCPLGDLTKEVVEFIPDMMAIIVWVL